LRAHDGGESADEQRRPDGKMLHTKSICRIQAGT
jgi:hypothetical protein